MSALGYVSAIRAAVAERLDQPSTTFQDQTRTWSETLSRAARIAGGLAALGVGDGDRVAVLSANTDLYVELYLAIPWCGAIIVPLNTRWTADENDYALGESDPRVVIVADGMDAATVEALRRRQTSRLVWARDDERPPKTVALEELLATEPVEDAGRAGTDVAAIFYTGGTTGRPKGVTLSHRGLVGNALAVRDLGLFPEGCIGLTVPPLFHLAAVTMTTCNMLAGGSVIILPGFDPDIVLEALESAAVTDVLLVPTMIQMLLDAPSFTPTRLKHLRRVVYGASPIGEGTLDRILAAAPQTDFYQAYGMTETSCCATLLPPQFHRGDHRTAGRHRAAGHPVRDSQILIVDEAGRSVPTGTVGEILVQGPGVMLGYWNQPEQTALAVRDGWMHTGDGGRLDEDGLLYVVDRLKDMIVTGGENVFSGEVESVLSKHPAVLQCAVIGVADERWGERVHAIVVLRPGHRLSEPDVIAHCRLAIAAYKCPRSVEIRNQGLPLSPQGKVQKNVLRAQFQDLQTSRNLAAASGRNASVKD